MPRDAPDLGPVPLNLQHRPLSRLHALCCRIGNFSPAEMSFCPTRDRQWAVSATMLLLTVAVVEFCSWLAFLSVFKDLVWWLPVGVAVLMALVTLQLDRTMNAADLRRRRDHPLVGSRASLLTALRHKLIGPIVGFGPKLLVRILLSGLIAQVATIGILTFLFGASIQQQLIDEKRIAIEHVDQDMKGLDPELRKKYRIPQLSSDQENAKAAYVAEDTRLTKAITVAECNERRADWHEREEADGQRYDFSSTLPAGCPALAADRPVPRPGRKDGFASAERDAGDAAKRRSALLAERDRLKPDAVDKSPALSELERTESALAAATKLYAAELSQRSAEQKTLVETRAAQRDPLVAVEALFTFLSKRQPIAGAPMALNAGWWLVALIEAVFMMVELVFVIVLTFLKPSLIYTELLLARDAIDVAQVQTWVAACRTSLQRDAGTCWRVDNFSRPEPGAI